VNCGSCGRRYPRRTDDPGDQVEQARAAGWAVRADHSDAMCPTCRRPDPTLVALCRELAGGH
jgi:hypothetical protein